jgi:hypothetical protein
VASFFRREHVLWEELPSEWVTSSAGQEKRGNVEGEALRLYDPERSLF